MILAKSLYLSGLQDFSLKEKKRKVGLDVYYPLPVTRLSLSNQCIFTPTLAIIGWDFAGRGEDPI